MISLLPLNVCYKIPSPNSTRINTRRSVNGWTAGKLGKVPVEVRSKIACREFSDETHFFLLCLRNREQFVIFSNQSTFSNRRRREAGHDWCIIQLSGASTIKAIHVDTAFFTGNHAPVISVAGAFLPKNSEYS